MHFCRQQVAQRFGIRLRAGGRFRPDSRSGRFEQIPQGILFIVAVSGGGRYGVMDLRDLRFPDRKGGKEPRHLLQGERHFALPDDGLFLDRLGIGGGKPPAGGACKGADQAPESHHSLHLFCSGAGPGSFPAKYRKASRVRKKGNE